MQGRIRIFKVDGIVAININPFTLNMGESFYLYKNSINLFGKLAFKSNNNF